MRLTSPEYADGGTMPARFAGTGVAGGMNASPPLSWDDPPAGALSFALAVIDVHPVAHHWVHWLVADISGDVRGLAERASLTPAMPPGSLELASTFGRSGYGGPQPPAGTGPHDYVATLYALDVSRLGAHADSSWEDVQTAMAGHVLGTATLVGRFGR